MADAGGRTGRAYAALRRIVLHRDGPTCALCGEQCRTTGDPNAIDYATIDHIIPLSHARTAPERRRLLMDPANSRIACRRCNSRRGATVGVTNPLPGW